MNYIVLDLEWNQSPNGKQYENKKIPFEIIDIGAVKLDENRKIISTFSEMVRPRLYKKMHYKTKEIVQITAEELNASDQFAEVFERFYNWCGDEEYIFCTWGSMDLTELQRNMKYNNVKHSLKKPLIFYDIQKMFSYLYEDRKSRRTLHYAVDYFKIDVDIPFHRALCDAEYTVNVMQKMDFDKVKQFYSIDYYNPPKTKEEEIHAVFNDYSKYVSREFDNKELAIDDREVVSMRCCRCNKNLKKNIKWFSYNTKLYYCLGYCDIHGLIKGKIRMKKSENGNIYVIKTMKKTDDEGAKAIYVRQDEVRTRRKDKRKRKQIKD